MSEPVPTREEIETLAEELRGIGYAIPADYSTGEPVNGCTKAADALLALSRQLVSSAKVQYGRALHLEAERDAALKDKGDAYVEIAELTAQVAALREALREISEIGPSNDIEGHSPGDDWRVYDQGYADGLCVQGKRARAALGGPKYSPSND